MEGELQLCLSKSKISKWHRRLVASAGREEALADSFGSKAEELRRRRETLPASPPEHVRLARDWAHLFPNAAEPLEILSSLPKPRDRRKKKTLAIAMLLLLPSSLALWLYGREPEIEVTVASSAAARPLTIASDPPVSTRAAAPVNPPRPKVGWIKVYADPDVTLYLDNRLVPQDSWDRIEAKPGLRQLKLVKEGFLPIVNSIEVKANKTAVVKARSGT